MTNRPEYWKKYYEKHKEKILAKNRAWSKSPKGKECIRGYIRARLLREKPDRSCTVCDKPLDKLSKRRLYCTDVCSTRAGNKARYYRIKNDPVKYAKRLEQLRGYRQHAT